MPSKLLRLPLITALLLINGAAVASESVESATADPSGLQQAVGALFAAMGFADASPPADFAQPMNPGDPEQQLAAREAELAALAEQNRLREQQLDSLAELVREREADLSRRTAEQAELAERLARLEALMGGAQTSEEGDGQSQSP